MGSNVYTLGNVTVQLTTLTVVLLKKFMAKLQYLSFTDNHVLVKSTGRPSHLRNQGNAGRAWCLGVWMRAEAGLCRRTSSDRSPPPEKSDT